MLLNYLQLRFPILLRELMAAANNNKTFHFRSAYCFTLYSVFIATSFGILLKFFGVNHISSLTGTGSALFKTLSNLQYLGLLFFIPLFTADIISDERERETLLLLRTTGLQPRNIFFEKFLGRIIPLLSLQLLTLPLAAIIYSLGGVTLAQVINYAIRVLLLTFSLGSLSLLCSTLCARTSHAYISSYSAEFITLALFMSLARKFPIINDFHVEILLISSISIICIMSAYLIFRQHYFSIGSKNAGNKKEKSWLSSNLKQRIKNIKTLNKWPVMWLEAESSQLKKTIFGKCLLILSVIAAIYLLVLIFSETMAPRFFLNLGAIFWLLIVLYCINTGAGIVAREESYETLDLLLASPITGWEIIHQKVKAGLKLLKFMTICLCIYYLLVLNVCFSVGVFNIFIIFVLPFLTYLYCHSLLWLSCQIALFFESYTRGLVISIVLFLIAQVIPFFSGPIILFIGMQYDFLEHISYRRYILGPIIGISIYFAFSSAIWLWITNLVQERLTDKIDQLIGRAKVKRNRNPRVYFSILALIYLLVPIILSVLFLFVFFIFKLGAIFIFPAILIAYYLIHEKISSKKMMDDDKKKSKALKNSKKQAVIRIPRPPLRKLMRIKKSNQGLGD